MKMRTSSSSSSSALLPLPLLLLPLLLLVANVAALYRLVDGIAVADCDGCTYEWQQLGDTIVGEQAFESFGSSVAMSNDGRTVAVGAPYSTNSNNKTDAGATRVYTMVNGTDEWVQLGDTIEGEQAGEFFGSSVAMSNDGRTMAVGAQDYMNSNNDTFAGATRVYTMVNGTDEWVQLGNTIVGEQAYEYSGISVALSNDGHTVAAGAPRYTSSNGDSQSGATRVYALI